MRVPHTALSRLAAVASGLLIAMQLIGITSGDRDVYLEAVLLAVVTTTALASAKFYRDNCFESRSVMALAVATSAAGVGLASTIGLPGRGAHPIGILGGSTVLLSAAVLCLLAADQPRRAAEHKDRSPYAA